MKTITLFRSPDASENPVAATVTKKPVAAQLSTDIDLGAVCTKVDEAWSENPNISLLWITQGDFSITAAAFNNTITDRNTVGSNRPSLTQTINIFDKQMDEAIIDVKIYIAKKYKKAGAVAQYARFGIEKTGRGYQFPIGQESRLASIKLMASSIVADGMGNEEYGKDFWEAMHVNYQKAVADASDTAQMVSGSVATKNVLRTQLEKVLASLRLVLKGNYPDTYTSVYRTWGWLKEKY